MKKRPIAFLLAAAMLLGMLPTAFAAEETVQTTSTGYAVPLEGETEHSIQATTAEPTQQQAYNAMIALKSKYPEGMRWTNDNYYEWKGGIFSGGFGCAGFAFLLSDAAFGDLPARMISDFSYEQLRVGDILRINHDSHSVIILKIDSSRVTIAEGNYSSSIHWGRTLTKAQVMQADYMMTRYICAHTFTSKVIPPSCTGSGYTQYTCTKCGYQYQDNYDYTIVPHTWDCGKVEVIPTSTQKGYLLYTCTICGWNKTESISTEDYAKLPVYQIFRDVQPNAWYLSYVQDAYRNGLMSGTSATTFAPNAPLTRAQVVQILYNNANKPNVIDSIPFTDVKRIWYYNAVCWAYQQGVVAGTSATTFAPDAKVTRETLAVMLYNHAGRPSVSGSLDRFPDGSKVSGWAKDAMLWAVGNGIISGSASAGKTYLNPQGNATRAEAATIMTKYLS